MATALIGAFKEVFLAHLSQPHAVPDRAALAQSLFEFGVRGLFVAT